MRRDHGGDLLLSSPASALVDAYLQMRPDLSRFVAARLGGQADVEDVLQELYLKASRTPETSDIRDPRAYLYRLASNLMMDRWRSTRRAAARDGAWRLAFHGAEASGDVDDAPSAEATVDARQRLQALVRALDALPEKTRSVFRLHKFDGLSYAEVAEREGMSRSSVEKHMMQALRVLAERTRS
ncbi:MAG TPA: RNA polymerase subunit sigma-24 [Brevundimonas sp.]|nr:RNA polymerase subunit sigma-24 [Brevundimonas sp.]